MFDRHGPEAANRLRAYAYGLVVFGLSVPMSLALSSKLGFGLLGLILVTLVVGATLASGAVFFGLRGGQMAADVAQYVTAGGSSTPYEDQFSQEQALVMKRDYAGALELFERRLLDDTNDARVRIAAADLYALHGKNPQRAAELYREVQRLPAVGSGQDIYATNKLADLFLGPLKQPGRALVEFRRLVDRYPGSAAADHARTAIANLKPDVVKGQSNS
jgi:hypothetical protein